MEYNRNNNQNHVNDYYNRDNNEFDVYSNRFRRYDDRYDYRYDRDFDDRRYDYDRMRYYRYPYCDRYGRCDNSLWWLFWPFFFL
ncbi:hypothetical protein [Sedimentibacter sp. MB31-C6]|uniref:hypothetical protein n=1 Tax=Sedimentibacter sp. MB31-C6 TaxID=3109366 RepID=UPI002DDC941B|nr:hypothetical protein [Sedimentibacter sp. MB36-C1]WSI05485.1 hypothetical protein U8307_06760 [Sedimentibacter sp. MB36-C1]